MSDSPNTHVLEQVPTQLVEPPAEPPPDVDYDPNSHDADVFENLVAQKTFACASLPKPAAASTTKPNHRSSCRPLRR